MADAREMFPGQYLKSVDLKGRTVRVTIAGLTMEEVEKGKTLPVLHFVGKDRGLVLNKTNMNMLADYTGTFETNDWIGCGITLTVQKVPYQGKLVDGIRIVGASAPATAPARAVAMPRPVPAPAQTWDETGDAVEPAAVTDEDIPF